MNDTEPGRDRRGPAKWQRGIAPLLLISLSVGCAGGEEGPGCSYRAVGTSIEAVTPSQVYATSLAVAEMLGTVKEADGVKQIQVDTVQGSAKILLRPMAGGVWLEVRNLAQTQPGDVSRNVAQEIHDRILQRLGKPPSYEQQTWDTPSAPAY
jgi:hypothetical protein